MNRGSAAPVAATTWRAMVMTRVVTALMGGAAALAPWVLPDAGPSEPMSYVLTLASAAAVWCVYWPKVTVTSETLLVRGVLRTRHIPIEDVLGAEPCFRGGSFICVAGRRDLFTGIGLPFGPGTEEAPAFDEVVRSAQARGCQPRAWSVPGQGGLR